MLVVLRSGGEAERDCSSVAIHQRGELGVEPALGPAHRLRALSARRIRSVLMQLDVRAIQMVQLTGRSFCQAGQDQVPQSLRTSATE